MTEAESDTLTETCPPSYHAVRQVLAALTKETLRSSRRYEDVDGSCKSSIMRIEL